MSLNELAEMVKGDTGNPVREALFRRCTRKGQWMYGGHWTRNGEDGDACPKCDSTGFQRRSRAESALWEALKPVMIEYDWILVPAMDGWEIWKDNDEIDAVNDLVGQGATPDDALAAAEVARRKGVRDAEV